MPTKPRRDNEKIADISQRVYELELGAEAVARMLAADNDGGAKLRRRGATATRNAQTVRYLTALGLPIPTLNGVDHEEKLSVGLFDC